MRAQKDRTGGSPFLVTRRVPTCSYPSFSMESNIVFNSDGGSCRSASITVTRSPFAARSPASIAASFPKFREKETNRTFLSFFLISFIYSVVPSDDPSSANIFKFGDPVKIPFSDVFKFRIHRGQNLAFVITRNNNGYEFHFFILSSAPVKTDIRSEMLGLFCGSAFFRRKSAKRPQSYVFLR